MVIGRFAFALEARLGLICFCFGSEVGLYLLLL